MSRLNKTLLIAIALMSFAASDALAQRANRTRNTNRNRVQRVRQSIQRTFRRVVQPTNRLQNQNQTLRNHLQSNGVRLSKRDLATLDGKAQQFEGSIRRGYTNRVDFHVAEATTSAGVRFTKVSGSKGPNIFEVTGTEKTGGVVNLVLTGGASGHVMQQQYGGRPMSTVEQYGQTDIIHLTHKGPGASSSSPVLKVQSRGLITQEGFQMKLSKGEHTFYYFRRGANGGGSGGEGSEPELRTIKLLVK